VGAQRLGGALTGSVSAFGALLAVWRDYPRPLLIVLLALAAIGFLLAVLPGRRPLAQEERPPSTTFRQRGGSRLVAGGTITSSAETVVHQDEGSHAHLDGDVEHDPGNSRSGES
jgi:hypothetical protein